MKNSILTKISLKNYSPHIFKESIEEVVLYITVNNEKGYNNSQYITYTNNLHKWIESFQTLEYELQIGVYKKMLLYLKTEKDNSILDYFTL